MKKFSTLPQWQQDLILRKREQQRMEQLPDWQKDLINKKKVANNRKSFENKQLTSRHRVTLMSIIIASDTRRLCTRMFHGKCVVYYCDIIIILYVNSSPSTISTSYVCIIYYTIYFRRFTQSKNVRVVPGITIHETNVTFSFTNRRVLYVVLTRCSSAAFYFPITPFGYFWTFLIIV